MIEIYDAQDSEAGKVDDSITEKSDIDDEDKVLFQLIGKTEISIDKVLSNLLVVDEYATYRNIILQASDDPFSENEDIFSNHSVAK